MLGSWKKSLTLTSLIGWGFFSSEASGSGRLTLETKIWNANDEELFTLEKQAIKELQRDPDSAYVHYLLTHLNLRIFIYENKVSTQNDFDHFSKAMELAQQAIQLAPQSEWGYLALTDCLDLLGDNSKLQDLKAILLKPNLVKSWRTQFLFMRLAAKTLPPQEVQNMLLATFASPGANYEILSPYLIALSQKLVGHDRGLQDKDLELSFLEHVSKRYKNPTLDLFLAKQYYKKNEIKKAQGLFRELKKSMPESLEPSIYLAIIDYEKFSNLRESIAKFEDLLNVANPSVEERSIITLHLATAKLKRGDWRSEKDFIKKLYLTSIPQLPPSIQDEYLLYVFQQFAQAKKYTELTELLQAINQEFPGRANLYHFLGNIYHEVLKNNGLAIEAYGNAITLEPQNNSHYEALGLTYYRLNDFESALAVFSDALTANPNDSSATYNKACMLSLLGKEEESLDFLKKAFQLNPVLKEKATNDSDLNNLKGLQAFKNLLDQQEISQN